MDGGRNRQRSRQKLSAGTLAFVTLLAAGCTRSSLSGSDGTTTTAAGQAPVGAISGTALDATGGPYGGKLVILRENRGIANDLFGTFAAAVSLGLTCAAGADPCRASGAVSTNTSADGRFTFDAAAVQKAEGRSTGVALQFGDPARDGSLVVRLSASPGGDLGPLALWNPVLTSTPAGADAILRWQGPPMADIRTILNADIVDGAPTGVRAPAILAHMSPHGPSTEQRIDRRALEDRPAVAVLSAGFSRPRAGQQPRTDWTSAPVRLPAGAGRPLSRGAACTLDGPAPVHACPLTDGDLTTEAVTAGPSSPVLCPPGPTSRCPSPVRSAVVDLGKAQPVGLVAVRDHNSVTVEVSSDGQTYSRATATRRSGVWPATVVAVGGNPIRYIRVTPGEEGGLNPSEVSAWPPEPPPALAAAPALPGDLPTAPSAPSARPGASRGHHRGYLLAIGVLVLLGVAVAGYLIGRRRGQP